ncbi:MAG: hypothetical protein HS111_19425 [Kofleriaceae bacterium]|nr:hypothetical protein [Kofleriaceae bacterium]MCL4226671.1 hypothetical protein [Myxococcales bacterium]
MPTRENPPPLAPAATTPAARSWFLQHAVGLATLVIGALALVVFTVRQESLWAMPDWRHTVPFFVATCVGTVVAVARREGLWVLPLAGLGLAAVTMVLGWFLVMAAIAVVTAIVILIMSAVM